MRPLTAAATDYKWNIANCNARPIGPGTQLEPENGNMVGPTKQGIEDLIALDPGRTLGYGDEEGMSAAAWLPGPVRAAPGSARSRSFNPDTYASTKTNGNTVVTVTHVLGFWIESITSNGDVLGYFIGIYPKIASGTSTLTPTASFLRTIILVR